MIIEYNSTFFNSEKLIKAASEYKILLPDDVNFLVSTGSSGCSIASALLMLCTDKHLYHLNFRKEGESCHSGLIAGSTMKIKGNGCIVDDFMDTGKTVLYIIKKFNLIFGGDDRITLKYIMVGNDSADTFSYLNGVNNSNSKLIKDIKLISIPIK